MPPRSGHRSRIALLTFVMITVVTFVALIWTSVRWTPHATADDPFAAHSPFKTPIPDNPELDPDSAAMVEHLAAEGGQVANLYEFGVPIYYADSSTPEATVTCTKPWGTCSLEDGPVRIPEGATPHTGSDGKLVIVDVDRHRSYELWQAERTGAHTWTASWGGWVSIDGDGRDGAATGAGVSNLAGTIRLAEIEAGEIPHALVFATDNSCRTFRWPAIKSDGHSVSADCIPEGARVQLDPSIDVASIPEITPAEIAVATALQTYGAYNIDNAAAPLALNFELPKTGDTDPYPEAGLPWDYANMPHIPWEHLRVLAEPSRS